jgi:hypothetical protein
MMAQYQIFTLILFLFAGSLQLKAQEIDPDDSFTFDLCLPNAMGNQPYQNIMQGLVHASMH